MPFRLFVVLAVLGLTACATKTAYISSVTDPAYSPRKSDPIYLLIPDGTSIEDRQFSAFVLNEMRAAGFTMVPSLIKSRYVLLLRSDEKTSQINSTLFMPQTSSTSGYIGNTYFTGRTTSTIAVPYTRSYTVHKTWLQLYSTSDLIKKKYQTAWEGYIGADASDFKEQSAEILHLLLDVFGKNYEAHAKIRPASGP